MTWSTEEANAMRIHGIVHALAKHKARGGYVPISTTALIKWHKESASELMRKGLAHRSPLERFHIEGPVGSEY